MTSSLQLLLPYLPPTLARSLLDRPDVGPAREVFPAAVLFADVSGFTALTEALSLRGAEGPEELTRLLNAYFGVMIEHVTAAGGEVVKFSGDALTALFLTNSEPLSHAARRALHAAEAMQAAMYQFNQIETSVGVIRLSMKIGIGAGTVYAFRVGGFFRRWEYVVAGDPLRQVAEAEHHAHPGDTILSPEAQAVIWPTALLAQPYPPLTLPTGERPDLTAAFGSYIPAAVRGWINSGLGDWIAVLRAMSVLFVGISGLEYDQPVALNQVQTFLHDVQSAVYRYEGSINKLVVDDKGTVLMVLFGAPPFAHVDDPSRAIRCALDLRSVADKHQLRMAIGVATGPVFAGPVGSPARREYTAIGDTVNLAARLMGATASGAIRCNTATARSAGHEINFTPLPPISVKGKAEPVTSFQPTGLRTAFTLDEMLVNRSYERGRISHAVAETAQGRPRILIIIGETGMGKSRLLDSIERKSGNYQMRCLRGDGILIELHVPYRPWIAIFRRMFALDTTLPLPAQQAHVAARVARLSPTLSDRLALLNELLGLRFEPTPAIAAMSTSARFESRTELLIEILRQQATQLPLVLLIDDAQWVDSLSWQLIQAVAQTLSAARLPLLLVLGMRPFEKADLPIDITQLRALPEAEELQLKPFTPQDTINLVALRLGVATDQLPPAILQPIIERVGGNPFFTEALTLALRDSGLIRIEHETGVPPHCELATSIDRIERALPATVQGAVLARIDPLDPENQIILKAAAVLGLHFEVAPLLAALADTPSVTAAALQRHLAQAEALDLIVADSPVTAQSYYFCQSMIHDVIYTTLAFQQRRALHRKAAHWYAEQRNAAAPLHTSYVVCAYHWEHAGEFGHALENLARAGDAALAVSALHEARKLFEQALALLNQHTPTDHAAKISLTRRLGMVCWQMGDYRAAKGALHESLTLARLQPDHTATSEALCYLGRIELDTGAFAAASALLEEALAMTRQAHDEAGEVLALRFLGMTALANGNFVQAQDYFTASLQLARMRNDRFAEASTLNSLATVAAFVDDNELAEQLLRESLAINQALGHRWSIAVIEGNLGEIAYRAGRYAEALTHHRASLAISLQIGDRFGIVNTHNNLGETLCTCGDLAAAMNACSEALRGALEIGNGLLMLYSLYGAAKLSLAQDRAETAAELIGLLQQHPASTDDVRAQINATLDSVATHLNSEQLTNALARGANMELETAVRKMIETLQKL